MARITCEVHNCDYNDRGGCRLSSVRVDGSGAGTSCETYCGSYTDKTEQGFVSCAASECKCESSAIKCDAEDCRYNEAGNCEADRIRIGPSDACSCDDTECRTFKK